MVRRQKNCFLLGNLLYGLDFISYHIDGILHRPIHNKTFSQTDLKHELTMKEDKHLAAIFFSSFFKVQWIRITLDRWCGWKFFYYRFYCWNLNPYIWGAVATWISCLMGQWRAFRFRSKVDEEVRVYGQASFLCVDVDLQHVGTFLHQFWIKLTIPCTEKRVGDIQPLPVQAQLDHLWPASQSMSL